MQETFTKWSWSMLQVYRNCHYQARLKYLEHSPEPPRKKDDPRDRGSARHKMAEDFVLATDAPFPQELIKFEGPLTDARNVHRDGIGEVKLEKKHFFDQNWKPCEEKDRWLIIIPDLTIKVPDQFSLTVDYKTGRRYGNELKHYGQCELYSVAAWIEDPRYTEQEAELWYLDQKEIWPITFTAEQLDKARARLDKEVTAMMADKVHRPNPSKQTCKYCPFSPRGTGACPVGV